MLIILHSNFIDIEFIIIIIQSENPKYINAIFLNLFTYFYKHKFYFLLLYIFIIVI